MRYIVTQDTAAALTIKAAAKGACIRPLEFAKALRNAEAIRVDAVDMGIDPDELRWIRQWKEQIEADDAVHESRIASGVLARDFRNGGIRRIPPSHKYHGSNTLLGVTCPNPGGSRNHRDELGCPINTIEHPEPQGEWHNGLNECGRRAHGWR